MNSRGVSGRIQLGYSLTGLVYLQGHKVAHRDVKPANFVCYDETHRLRLLLIEVEDENTEIDDFPDSKDWTVPEMEKQDGTDANAQPQGR